jgi:hypothetical protein
MSNAAIYIEASIPIGSFQLAIESVLLGNLAWKTL